jgi:SPP1 family predicted phage head-tail adaptor
MRAGKLRQRVTIQQPTTGQDSYGGETVTWSDLATVWAEVVPLRSGEVAGQDMQQGQATHRVRIRYRAGITQHMQLLFDGRVFTIHGQPVNVGQRNIMLDIDCREAVA